MNENPAVHVSKFCVGADHPSLPGHFPGKPIVPAVVVLNFVLGSISELFGPAKKAYVIEQAKFLAPLLPSEVATATFTLEGGRLHFSIERERTIVAQGLVRIESAGRRAADLTG